MTYGESIGHVTMKGQGHDPSMLRTQYRETARDAIWQQSLTTRESAVMQYSWLS